MKKQITYVPQEKFAALIAELGLRSVDQAGFTKVILPNSPRLYVARTKRVGRVDVAVGDRALEIAGVRHLGSGEAFGLVHHQLDFTRTEDEILASFRELVKFLSSLPAPEPKAPKAPRAKKGARVEGTTEPKGEALATAPRVAGTTLTPEQRRALIEQAARAKAERIAKSAEKAGA
jgi:hypothetical protein